MFNRLRVRLTLIFILLAVIPVILTGGLLSLRNFQELEDQALVIQQQEARIAATDILNFIEERESQLKVISDVRRIDNLERSEQATILSSLLRYDGSYEELALLDGQGQELLRITRNETFSEAELVDRSQEDEYLRPFSTGSTYFSPIYFNEITQEPLITIALPLQDIRTGEIGLILIAEFRFRPIWDFIANINLLDENDAVYVTDSSGALVAHANPSLVLSRRVFDLPEENGQAQGLSGEEVILAQNSLQFGEQELIVVAERPLAVALAPATTSLQIAALLLVIAVVVAIILTVGIVRRIVIPVEKLSATAQKIASGNLTAHAEVTSQDEIGDLARSFNSMTHQLTDLIDNLERRVQERTRDLQMAANVSTQVTTILDQDQLLTEVVTQLREGFDFYTTTVYLFNESEKLLTLATSAAREGVKLPSNMSYPLDATSIISKSARDQEALIVNDVTSEANRQLVSSSLKAGSEFAAPMQVGQELIGVLHFQSEEVNHFTESDLQVLSLVTRQIGIAIRNVRSFQVEADARQAAEEANQIKSQFLANMSHELRTPLNAILNFTGFVSSGVMGPVNELQEKTLEDAISSGKHLLSLINDVLDVTKIESGMMDLFIQEVNMNELVSATESVAKGLIKEREIEFFANLDELPITYGDKRRLRQVLLNLISNAVKFTKNGRITFSAKQIDNRIHIEVADTGIGIAQDDQYLVFESFKQAKHDLPEVVGTGLGMPITKYFVEIHGGTIRFESEPNKGTTFFVELPILSESEAKAINDSINKPEAVG